jgi:hypothetical protein
MPYRSQMMQQAIKENKRGYQKVEEPLSQAFASNIGSLPRKKAKS